MLSTKDDSSQLKATDFGLSVFYKPGQLFSDVVGSAYYVAPEVICPQFFLIFISWREFLSCR